MVTLEELQDLVYYDPSDRTFCLVWKPRLIDNSGFNTRLAGTKAGCMTAQGYVHVYINGAARKLHRLVYMLHNNIKKLSDAIKAGACAALCVVVLVLLVVML